MASISEIRRTKNELTAQHRNTAIVRQLTKLAPGEVVADLPLEFICECSDLNCHERVTMTIGDYQQQIKDPARFVISPHHEQTDIEKVLKRTDDHTLVEKRPDLIRQVKTSR
jgi:hypothetical protein